jgi:hypothetical protein
MNASVKSTNKGVYGTSKVQWDEMLFSLADLIMEVGNDQARRPKKLENRSFDLEDTNPEQYKDLIARQAANRKDLEDRVKEHAGGSKKRMRKANRMMAEAGNFDGYEMPAEDFDEFVSDDDSAEDEDDVPALNFPDDPDAAKYLDEEEEATTADAHFKKRKTSGGDKKKTQSRTRNIRSKADLEKNEDEDFLIKAITASRATSSTPASLTVEEQILLQDNAARLELLKIQANHDATLRLIEMCMMKRSHE